MKRTNAGVVEQMRSYQHSPNNELPLYLANVDFYKETKQWLEIQNYEITRIQRFKSAGKN